MDYLYTVRKFIADVISQSSHSNCVVQIVQNSSKFPNIVIDQIDNIPQKTFGGRPEVNAFTFEIQINAKDKSRTKPNVEIGREIAEEIVEAFNKKGIFAEANSPIESVDPKIYRHLLRYDIKFLNNRNFVL